MENEASLYHQQNIRIWQQYHEKIKEQFNKETYQPKIDILELEYKQQIVWLRYGKILTTMILSQEWSPELITNNTSFLFQAQAQTAGRGQGANVWTSPPGNLYITLLTKVDVTNLHLVPIISSSAILKTINEVLPNVKVNCKWVNDIFIENQKVGGLMVKCVLSNNKFFTQIGIGVNLNKAPIEGFTCLKHFAQKQIEIDDFAKKIARNLFRGLANPKQSFNYYQKSLLYLNQKVKILNRELTTVLHEGIFLRINESGHAILNHNGQEVTVSDGRMREEAFGK